MTHDELIPQYTHMHEHSHYGNCPNDSARAMAAAQQLLERMQPGDTVLDCSAGRGHFLEIMRRRGMQCSATEADPCLIGRELAEYETWQLRYDELGKLAPRQWDAVVSIEVLEHLLAEDEARAALRALAGLTRKWLLISVGLFESSWHGIDNELVKLHFVVKSWMWWLDQISEVATVLYEDVGNGSLMVLAKVIDTREGEEVDA
jgi:hypothetical protein